MRRLLPVLAFALVAWTTGCSDSNPDSTNNPGKFGNPGDPGATGMGLLRIRLTDAPYPYSSISSADIAVDAVEVRMSDGLHMLPVDAAPVALNLLDLQNGVTEMLVDTEVPVGNIDQIRLIISSASVTLSDGRVFDLMIPSGASSGLKISVSPSVQVAEQLTSELLLDFDVSQSFEPIPNSAKKADEISRFKFHPVLRVANVSQSGTVSGHVWNSKGTMVNTSDDSPMVGASVTVLGSESSLVQGSTASGVGGSFRISGLAPGTHIVRAEAPGFAPVDIEVTVVAGNEISGNEIRLVGTVRTRTRTSVAF